MIEGGAGVNRGSVGATVAGPVGRAVLKAALGQPTPKPVTPTYSNPSYQNAPSYQPTPTYTATVTPNYQGNGNGGNGNGGTGNGTGTAGNGNGNSGNGNTTGNGGTNTEGGDEE